MEAIIALIVLGAMVAVACLIGHFIAAWFGMVGLMIWIALCVVFFCNN